MDVSAILGKWKLDGNGYPGSLEFKLEGGQLTARLNYDVAKKWETLTNVKFVPDTGVVSFTRPWAGNPGFQQYQGRLVDGIIRGQFTDNHSPGQPFPWSTAR